MYVPPGLSERHRKDAGQTQNTSAPITAAGSPTMCRPARHSATAHSPLDSAVVASS